MNQPAARSRTAMERRAFYTEQIKDPKNHDALVLEITYLQHKVASLENDLSQLKEPPLVVVNVSGGIVQGASSTRPVELLALDFDTDGEDDGNLIAVDDGQCTAVEHQVAVDPPWVGRVLDGIKVRDQGPPGLDWGDDGEGGAGDPSPEPVSITLFAVSGRNHGDDDDSVRLLWARTSDEANQGFKSLLLIEKGLTEENPDRPIYINGTNTITAPVTRKTAANVIACLSPELVQSMGDAFGAFEAEAAPAPATTAERPA